MDYKKNYFMKKLYINPPFSKISEWVNYGLKQYFINHCEVIFLIPARTDTKYFHELLSYSPDIYFIKGRLHYNESKTGAPFPSLFIRLKHQNPKEAECLGIELKQLIKCLKEGKL